MAKPSGKQERMTAGELADGLGVSDKTIRRYWRRGCPRHSVAAVVEWRRQHIKTVAEDAESSEVMMEIKRAERGPFKCSLHFEQRKRSDSRGVRTCGGTCERKKNGRPFGRPL